MNLFKSRSRKSEPASENALSEVDIDEAKSPFNTDDVVLITIALPEAQLSEIVRACEQSNARLLPFSVTSDAAEFARIIREEMVTVVITTGQHWGRIFLRLNQSPGEMTSLHVVFTDSTPKLEKRKVFLPRALSRAKIEDTYAAYRKGPWSLINLW